MKNKIAAVVFLSLLISCSLLSSGSPKQLYEKGRELATSGEKKKAFNLFKKAAKMAPDSALYYFAAAQVAPDQNTAFMYTKFAWEKGFKNRLVFADLLRYSFYIDKEKKLGYALDLLKELPDSLATDVFKGEIYFQFDKPDSAYTLWNSEFIRTEKSYLCPKIANALVRMGKSDQAIDFLYQCRNDKTIDSDGLAYLASLLAVQFNFKEVDRLFNEISSTNFYNDQIRLEHATYLAFNDRFDEALKLCRQNVGPGSAVEKLLLSLRFKTLGMYIAMMQHDTVGLARLLRIDSKDTVAQKVEGGLFDAIKKYYLNDTAAYELLKKAIVSFPPDPVTLLYCTDAAVKKKEYKDGLVFFSRMPGIVLWAPRMVVTRAQMLALAGEDDEALKVVSFMHKQRIFTRPSLELFRNLTLKKDLIDKSNAAQQLLEKQYSNDVGLKWKGLLMAIKAEKYDSALTISKELRGSHPDDERFELTELSLLLMKKEFRKVLDLTAKSSLPDIKIKPIEAAAFKGLGDTAMAIAAYESVVKDKKDPLLTMQLAEMYYQKKLYDKAQQCYTQLMGDNSASFEKDTLKLAVLLNNNAWTIVTSGAKDLSGALSMAKRAHEIAPDNLNILDTYASILNESGKSKECIKLLDGNKSAVTQKRLLCHLAKAYETTNNKNKAKRFYEDALACKKDDQKLSVLMTDEQIKNEILRLSE